MSDFSSSGILSTNCDLDKFLYYVCFLAHIDVFEDFFGIYGDILGGM